MNALLLAMLLAGGTPDTAGPDETDLRCYRLMADLARAEEPEARALGLTAAGYFLGRIDAAAPDYDLTRLAPVPEPERPGLLRRCADALAAGGIDFHSLESTPEQPGRTI